MEQPSVRFIFLVYFLKCVESKTMCYTTRVPVEMGAWHHKLVHIDSAVIENKPVSFTEGQVFVYENEFPGHIIKYVNVDNLAKNTKCCGAKATIEKGGPGTNTVLIVLEAQSNQGIRSVIDIWGSVNRQVATKAPATFLNNIKSKYLFGNVGVSHLREYIK